MAGDTHTEVLQQSREAAQALLARGSCSISEIARRTGLHRVTVQRMKSRMVRRPMSAGGLQPLEKRVEELEAELSSARTEVLDWRKRAERAAQEARDIRKKDRWQKMAVQLSFHAFDLLPESVWMALIDGEVVTASFAGDSLDDVDKSAQLVLNEESLPVWRSAIELRQEADLAEDVQTDTKARVQRFGRMLREQVYDSD